MSSVQLSIPMAVKTIKGEINGLREHIFYPSQFDYTVEPITVIKDGEPIIKYKVFINYINGIKVDSFLYTYDGSDYTEITGETINDHTTLNNGKLYTNDETGRFPYFVDIIPPADATDTAKIVLRARHVEGSDTDYILYTYPTNAIVFSSSAYDITRYVYSYSGHVVVKSENQASLPVALISNMFISCPFIDGEYKFTDSVFYLSNIPYELTTSQECYLLTPKT